VQKEKNTKQNCDPRFSHPAKQSFQYEGEIKALPFVTKRPVLLKMLKELHQAEACKHRWKSKPIHENKVH
jgi:hypothetical protein